MSTPAARRTDRPMQLLPTLGESLRNPAFWGYSTWLDIIIRYRKSMLGMSWILVPPALYVFGMGLFFAQVQKADPWDFMAHLGVGYLLFRLMTMVLVDSTSILPAHSGYDGEVRHLLGVVSRGDFTVARGAAAARKQLGATLADAHAVARILEAERKSLVTARPVRVRR